MESLSKELSVFSKSTSVKGIPRIAKNHSICLKCTWTIAALGFFAMALHEVGILMKDYYSWNAVADFRDELLDPQKEDILPKISLCNQQPIAGANQSNASEYYKYVNSITQCDDQCTDEEKALMADVQAQLLKPSGYFQQMDKEQADAVSQTTDSFFRECFLILLHGSDSVKLPCQGAGVDISTTLNPDYFRCHSITLPRKYHNRIVFGVSMVLFLDNPYITDSYYGADGGGAILVPHFCAGVGSPFLGGLNLAAGQHTVLQAKRHIVERLPEPYGACIFTNVTHREFTWRNITNCIVNMTRQYCNCTDVQHATFEEPYDVDVFPYCGNMSFGIDWVKEKTHCVAQLKTETCTTDSKLPCREHQYPVQTSLTAWPALSHGFESFYSDYILRKPGSDMFESVRQYIQRNCSNLSECGLLQQQADNLIRRNYLKFSFYLRDNYYTITDEQPKLQLLELFSQVGSILNLWSGITMIVFVELVELCYRLISGLCKKENAN